MKEEKYLGSYHLGFKGSLSSLCLSDRGLSCCLPKQRKDTFPLAQSPMQVLMGAARRLSSAFQLHCFGSLAKPTAAVLDGDNQVISY